MTFQPPSTNWQSSVTKFSMCAFFLADTVMYMVLLLLYIVQLIVSARIHGSAIDVYRSVFIAFEFWIIHPFTWLSCSSTCSANLVNGSVVSVYGSAVIVHGSADSVRKCIWFSYWCIHFSFYCIWVFHSFTWLSCSCTCSANLVNGSVVNVYGPAVPVYCSSVPVHGSICLV